MPRHTDNTAKSDQSNTSAHRSRHLLQSIASVGADQLQDSQMLEAMLDHPDSERARAILAAAGSLKDLAIKGPLELQALGLTWQESARMMVLLETVKRVMRSPQRRQLCSIDDLAADLCLRCLGQTATIFGLIGVNSSLEVLLDKPIAARESCDTHPRASDVYREAVRVGASGIVVWHNHLNGDPLPTPVDLAWTDELRMIGDVLYVSLVDHLILGDGCYYSLRAGTGWHP